jgi:hypothetical protein
VRQNKIEREREREKRGRKRMGIVKDREREG